MSHLHSHTNTPNRNGHSEQEIEIVNMFFLHFKRQYNLKQIKYIE